MRMQIAQPAGTTDTVKNTRNIHIDHTANVKPFLVDVWGADHEGNEVSVTFTKAECQQIMRGLIDMGLKY